jgi:hypothetical protein
MIASNLVSNAIRHSRQRAQARQRARDASLRPLPHRRHGRRATGASGLGLAIARRAVQPLGGYGELDSNPGKGSEFRVMLSAHGSPVQPARELREDSSWLWFEHASVRF